MVTYMNIPAGDQTLRLRLPGGPTLQCMTSSRIPSPLEVTKCLLNQVSTALAPLMPVFNLIDAMLAVKAFAEAVPELITDPTALIQAITDLIEKISALASLVPALSVPILIVDFIDIVILALEGIVTELGLIVDQLARIQAAELEAAVPGNEALLDTILRANQLLEQIQTSLDDSMGPLNSLFGVINLFMSLIGLEPIPSIVDLPEDPTEVIEALETTIEALRVVRQSIPIP